MGGVLCFPVGVSPLLQVTTHDRKQQDRVQRGHGICLTPVLPIVAFRHLGLRPKATISWNTRKDPEGFPTIVARCPEALPSVSGRFGDQWRCSLIFAGGQQACSGMETKTPYVLGGSQAAPKVFTLVGFRGGFSFDPPKVNFRQRTSGHQDNASLRTSLHTNNAFCVASSCLIKSLSSVPFWVASTCPPKRKWPMPRH